MAGTTGDSATTPSKKPLVPILVGLLVVALGVIVYLVVVLNAKKQVQVPDLNLQLSEDASKMITEAGLKLGTVTEEANANVKVGDVVWRQEPAANTTVDEGTKVDIVVSTGPKLTDPVTMPDLTGKTPEEAEQALFDLFLLPQPGDQVYSEDVEPGKVCMQSVAAGSQIMPLETVTYSTSLGREKVTVPNVTGMSIDEARSALKDVGLSCDTTTTYNDSVEKDDVISQDIQSGKEVDKGTTVELEVSLGERPKAQVRVPNILTYNLDDAKRTLESAGLACDWTGDEDGTVTSMKPRPGDQVEQGTQVNLTLKQSNQTSGSPLSEDDVRQIIANKGYGHIKSMVQTQENGVWYWEVTTNDADGNEETWHIAPDKSIHNIDDH
ncbi:MAG: PASTA domain-containing protein [Coriobacteriales bacterium]|nr:PASTA domain-containing protein [Coriobacteriales bacterium]